MTSPSSFSSGMSSDRRRNNLRVNTSHGDEDDNHIDLLMRHSSPIDRRNHPNAGGSNNNNPSPIMVRNSSPSLMGLSRPRSNPRNRTPMRYDESPLPTSTVGIPEEEEVSTTTEGRRITILPMAGSARGTNIASFRSRQDTFNPEGASSSSNTTTKSRKQGPSHRKVRRWNNDDFVNLAKEVGGSNKAAEALLRGHAHAGRYHSILPDNKKSIMTQLASSSTQSEELKYVRDKFFKGELHGKAAPATPKNNHKNHHQKPAHLLTRDDKFHRIDKRLRQVVTRAIENSLPATKVMERLEDFLIKAHTTNIPQDHHPQWGDILSQPPTISKHGGGNDQDKQIVVLRFSFDNNNDSSSNNNNAGFHRLLLHALVQFHGLSAHSTTNGQCRQLTASGYLVDTNHTLVDSIMERQDERLAREENGGGGGGGGVTNPKKNTTTLDLPTHQMSALKV